MSDWTTQDWLDIHGLADGQLTSDQQATIKARLSTDPTAIAEYESITQLKAVLRENCSPIMDEDAWRSSVSRLNAIVKAKKAETFVSKYAWGLCAVFLVAIISGGLITRRTGNTLNPGDVATMASGLLPIGLPSSKEPNSMKQYVQEKTGGAPINLALGHFQLVSVLQGVKSGKTITMFNFQDEVGPLSLVVVPDTRDVEGMSASANDRTYQHGLIGRLYCVSWVDQGFALLLLSQRGQRNTNDLQAIASSIRLQQQQ